MDYLSIFDAASFDTVATAIFAVAALIIVVVFIRWGARRILAMVR